VSARNIMAHGKIIVIVGVSGGGDGEMADAMHAARCWPRFAHLCRAARMARSGIETAYRRGIVTGGGENQRGGGGVA